MLRNRLTSRMAKRIYVWFFAVVLTAAIALRIEAAIYAGRIVSVVNALSTLREFLDREFLDREFLDRRDWPYLERRASPLSMLFSVAARR